MEKKKKFEELLTNECFGKRDFESQFDLVIYAIGLAENMIESGRDTRAKVDSKSRATQILAEIYQGKDGLDEIIIEKEYDRDRRSAPVKYTDVKISEDSSSKNSKAVSY